MLTDIEEEWELSDERYKAYVHYVTYTGGGIGFDRSQEFKNARYAFRRRMNNSPWSETT